jgi:transposase-like protein
MANHQKVLTRYSTNFKLKVVKQIEEDGLSISQVARIYGIKGGGTIQKWLKKYGKNHLLNKIVRVEMKGEKDRIKELEAEIRKLKMALADSTIENKALERLIEQVNAHYQTDVKKNLEPRQSKSATKKTGSR